MKHPPHDALGWIDAELDALALDGLRRSLRTHEGPQQALLTIDGRELVNFGSNDYLALAGDARLRAAAVRAIELEGVGGGASPLVTGHSTALAELEHRLAQFEGTARAVVFPSGYAANLGTITALAGPGDVIYADRLNHASMIDGCRLSRAEVRVYPHGDYDALATMLRADVGAFRRRLIATESLFSMDGDIAPLARLADLAEQFDCMLLVDEAHATGVFGERGRGLVEQYGLEDRVSVRIGTLSKSLGCAGGFVCGSQQLIDWLINRARPYIFSTALPPAVCAAAQAALGVIDDEPLRRQQLLTRAATLRATLRAAGWQIGLSESHIIPLIVGEPQVAVDLSERLAERGLLTPAIRPPSVPLGKSRLRISLTFGHTEAMIVRLVEALAINRAPAVQLMPQGS